MEGTTLCLLNYSNKFWLHRELYVDGLHNFLVENKGSAHLLGGVSGVASFINIYKQPQ